MTDQQRAQMLANHLGGMYMAQWDGLTADSHIVALLLPLIQGAERYRWLRLHSTQPVEPWSTHRDPESLDAAIDRAREHG